MILEDKPIGLNRGLTRKSLLDIVGRDRKVLPDGTVAEDWLLVDFNGNTCKVGIGFYGRVDGEFTLPEKAVIIHMVIDEKSATERLRFPVLDSFHY